MASDNPLDVPPAPQDLVRTCDRRGPMVNDRCIAACAAAAACMKVVRFTADGPRNAALTVPLTGPYVPLAPLISHTPQRPHSLHFSRVTTSPCLVPLDCRSMLGPNRVCLQLHCPSNLIIAYAPLSPAPSLTHPLHSFVGLRPPRSPSARTGGPALRGGVAGQLRRV